MIYHPSTDPALEILSGKRDIDKRIAAAEASIIDGKELREREEAASRYAGENEQHFAAYLQDCVDQSVTANSAIRETQAHCYRVYLEDEPVNYGKKDVWQSRIVVPKPFGTVQYGASAIRRAFTPKFLSVKNAKNKLAGQFWQKALDFQLNEQHGKFVLRFTDATTMALAIGISMEMIPQWIPGLGLTFSLVEPWKIHRDPDASSRDPQSGLYWIHQEWLDWHVLQQGEANGKYFNVARVRDAETPQSNNPWLTPEAIAKRKKMIWQRSTFRPMVLTSEFWGTVLSPKGEVLLPSARYTVAAGHVIQAPKAVPYSALRWPGISFSPLPDLLKFNGRGLLEGILSVWEAMCNLMCLHMDNLQWIVNPMNEINVDALVDPADTESWPGKEYLVHETANGQSAIREVLRRGKTNEVLANKQSLDQDFQRGTFVTDAVQGLPGYRKDMTYREAAMNLDQSLGVYSLMGENIEAGAIDAIVAAAEFISQYASYSDYEAMFSQQELEEFGIRPDPESPNGVSGVPRVDGSFHCSGIQALMKENEALTNIKTVIIPLAEHPRFAPYIKPYKALKAVELRTNLTDEGLIASEEEAAAIEAQQYAALAEQKRTMAESMDIQQAREIADLTNKIGPPSRPPPGSSPTAEYIEGK